MKQNLLTIGKLNKGTKIKYNINLKLEFSNNEINSALSKWFGKEELTCESLLLIYTIAS